MPELPEVETVCRGLEPVMRGQVLEDVALNRLDLRFPIDPALPDVLKGQQVSGLDRRGKYIICSFSSGSVFILHLGMSGRVRIVPGDVEDKPLRHDHAVFSMRGGARIIFNDARRFGYLLLSDLEMWPHMRPFSEMGPEPLGNDFSGPVLYERLKGRKAPIKSALLDQSVVAGLGNIYVCEALFEAGIDPHRQAGMLTQGECEDLSVAVKEVLLKAIEAGGSSLRDHRQTDGSMGYFQHSFSVYGRAGEVCRRCSGTVERSVQAGRSSFYCPACQK